ncbi:hypothetical protein BDW72DRAFT_208852 [Aspergillus terricola var. indicus]
MALPPKWYQFLVPSLIDAFQADATERGAVTSVFTGGAFFGAYFAGPLGDHAGRKWTIFVRALIFILGGYNLSYLYAGRSIAGLGVGILVMIVPIYQAELAHPDIRGCITSLQQLMLGVGSLAAALISWGTYINFADDDSRQWRISLGIQIVPAVFLAALILLPPDPMPWVQAEYEQITASIAHENEAAAKSYTELFTDPSCFRRLFLACSIQAAAQMTGVSAIQYYSTTIFEQIGIAADDTLKYQGISSILAIIAQFCCLMLIDKTGRRWPQILGISSTIIPTILIAKFPPGESHNNSASWAFIVMTWCYNFSYSATIGPLTWIICAEIFDTKTRSKGVSIATITSFAFNTMIGHVTDIAISNIGGWRYYIPFCICNFTNAIFFWLILPETALRPLEEMNALVKHEPWVVPGTQTKNFVSRSKAVVAEDEEKPGHFTLVHVEK